MVRVTTQGRAKDTVEVWQENALIRSKYDLVGVWELNEEDYAKAYAIKLQTMKPNQDVVVMIPNKGEF